MYGKNPWILAKFHWENPNGFSHLVANFWPCSFCILLCANAKIVEQNIMRYQSNYEKLTWNLYSFCTFFCVQMKTCTAFCQDVMQYQLNHALAPPSIHVWGIGKLTRDHYIHVVSTYGPQTSFFEKSSPLNLTKNILEKPLCKICSKYW